MRKVDVKELFYFCPACHTIVPDPDVETFGEADMRLFGAQAPTMGKHKACGEFVLVKSLPSWAKGEQDWRVPNTLTLIRPPWWQRILSRFIEWEL